MTRSPTSRTGLRAVFAQPGYRRLWSARTVSQWGDVFATVALALLVFDLTGSAFGINAASFAVSAVLLIGLRLPAAPARTDRSGFFADAAAGIRLLLADRLLRALGAGQLLAALSAGATSALLVVLARDHLALDPGGYGLLLGAIGVGAVLGPFLLTRLVRDPRRPLFVFGPYVLRGLVDLVLATFTALPLALVALAVYGMGTSSGAVTFNSLLQAHIPAHARGRVFASFDVFWQLGRLISLLVGGLLAAAIGIQAVYYLGGALLLLAAGIGWAGIRSPTPAG